MLGLAVFIVMQAELPMNMTTTIACVACVALGAILAVLPFLLDYRTVVRLTEAASVSSAVSQVQKIETVAAKIGSATSQWQAVQEHSAESVLVAKQLSERITAEMKDFMEFLQKANDSERSHLRLEVEKLRRGEADWVEVLVRVLDHIFALRAAAVKSGKQGLIEQLTHFQRACQDTTRRVGLVPFAAEVGAAFDEQKHHLPDGSQPSEGAAITATLAPGFTLRGQLVRPALVAVNTGEGGVPPELNPAEPPQSDEQPTREAEEPRLSL